MPTDIGNRQTQVINAANTEAAPHNLAGHRTGSTSACPASVCNFYFIDGLHSFIFIQGGRVSNTGTTTIFCVQFPTFSPVLGQLQR